MPALLQADVARAVRGALKGAGKMRVGSFTAEICNGAIVVTVTAATESTQPVADGAVDLEGFKEALRRRHAARRA